MAACSDTQWSKDWCFTVLLKIQKSFQNWTQTETEMPRMMAVHSRRTCASLCVRSGVFSAYFPSWGEDLADVCVGLILLILSDRQMRHICNMLTAGIQCILHLSKPFDQRWPLNRDSLLEKGVALHFWAQTFTPGFYSFSFYFLALLLWSCLIITIVNLLQQ